MFLLLERLYRKLLNWSIKKLHESHIESDIRLFLFSRSNLFHLEESTTVPSSSKPYNKENHFFLCRSYSTLFMNERPTFCYNFSDGQGAWRSRPSFIASKFSFIGNIQDSSRYPVGASSSSGSKRRSPKYQRRPKGHLGQKLAVPKTLSMLSLGEMQERRFCTRARRKP